MSQFAEAAKAPSEKKDAAPPTPSRRQARPPVLQRRAAARSEPAATPAAPSRSNLPGWIKAGTERLSGLSMDDVRVHHDSAEPAKLGALAFTRGSDIHLGPGQERHLPHEAWHVVQQKQGRVAATRQLKGMALNDQPSLEAEADRMGGQLGATFAVPASHRLREARATEIVQRTVMWGNQLYTTPPPFTPVATPLIESEHLYYMRDDCWFFQGKIHIIDSINYYILGDDHKASRFNKVWMNWKSVPHMREDLTEVPGDKGSFLATLGVEDRDPADTVLPLESAPVNSLQACLNVLNAINGLMKRAGKKGFLIKGTNPLKDSDFMDQRDEAAFIDVLAVLDPKMYSAYFKKNKPDSPYYQYLKLYHDNLKGKYLAGLKEISNAFNEIYNNLLDPKFAFHPDAPANLAPEFARISKGRAVLKDMILDLSKVVGITAASSEGKAMAKMAAPKAAYDPKQTNILMNVRDKDMADNVRARKPPLLVMVGNDHVTEIASKVPGAIPVPLGTDFEVVTQYPKTILPDPKTMRPMKPK